MQLEPAGIDAIAALTAYGRSLGYELRPEMMWEFDCPECGVRFTFARTERNISLRIQLEIA